MKILEIYNGRLRFCHNCNNKVKSHKRAIRNSKGRIVGYVRVKSHVWTRPTRRFSIFRKRRKEKKKSKRMDKKQ